MTLLFNELLSNNFFLIREDKALINLKINKAYETDKYFGISIDILHEKNFQNNIMSNINYLYLNKILNELFLIQILLR